MIGKFYFFVKITVNKREIWKEKKNKKIWKEKKYEKEKKQQKMIKYFMKNEKSNHWEKRVEQGDSRW